MEEVGIHDFDIFIETLISNEVNVSVNQLICKTIFPHFKSISQPPQNKAKNEIVWLKTNVFLFSRLYLACHSREGNTNAHYEHDKYECLPYFSYMDQLKGYTKSDLIQTSMNPVCCLQIFYLFKFC